MGQRFLAALLTLSLVCLALGPWAAIVVPVATAAGSTTYYVSPRGSDDAGEGTQDSPWRTISYAVSAAVAGDTIKVMDDDNEATDDYVENVLAEKSLTIERSDAVGPNPQVRAVNASEAVFRIIAADNAAIRGLDIHGAGQRADMMTMGYHTIAGVYACGCAGFTIEDCRVGWDPAHRNNQGISLEACVDCTVRRNLASSNLQCGIHLCTDGSTVESNVCNSNGKCGIELQNAGAANTFLNNACDSNHSHGILDCGNPGNRIIGNNLSNNGGNGLCTGSFTSNQIIYLNAFSNNLLGNVFGYGNTWVSPEEIDYTYGSRTYRSRVGNYYNDYTGTDNGSAGRVAGDGIGDTDLPYSGGWASDNYPLMTMFGVKADFSASCTAGLAPLEVRFTSRSIGDVSSWAWDFDGDGVTDSTDQNPAHTYDTPGAYTVSLSVSGVSGSDTRIKRAHVLVVDGLAWQTVAPDNENTVEGSTGTIRITFPAGAVTTAVTLVVTQSPSDNAPPTHSGFRLGDTYFSIEGVDHLEKEATICIRYTEADLAAAGGDASRLSLSFYDTALEEWVIVDTTVDASNQTLTATTSHFSQWAVMVESGSSGFPLWGWVLMGVAGGLVLVVLSAGFGYGLARRRAGTT